MNPLAEQLNQVIQKEAPHLFEMLSTLGKKFYFPTKGILSQSAEAKSKAHRFNATIGTAIENGEAMHLESLMKQLPGITADKALLYAPSPGNPALRQAWREKTLHDNPDLKGKACSLPIVTCGLSHALSLIGDTFVDEGDILIYPDKNWGNYALNLVQRHGAVPKYFKLFAGQGFNIEGFRAALEEAYAEGRRKMVVLLNFPNNPTGYTPTDKEDEQIADILVSFAERGVNVVAIVDDAYYGLFFKADVARQSLFSKLAGRHERLLAIKADAATKEVYVWGLRIGFISFSIGGIGADSPALDAVNQKLGGLIRANISNSCALSQYLVLNALQSPTFYDERAQKAEIMKGRALKVDEFLKSGDFSDAWNVYPFNSGYFMCLEIKGISASELRLYLLEKYGIGTIAINDTDLRVAFSCINEEDVPELYGTIYKACKELQK